MASTRGGATPFILTPQQQNLLFRALTSNQPSNGGNSGNNNSSKSNGNQSDGNSANQPISLSPESETNSPSLNQKVNGFDAANGYQESPLLDYDYDFGPDSSFDFDFANDTQASLIGDLPGTGLSKIDSKDSSPEGDNSDKRSLPNDEDDDEIEEGGGKRRESEGKAPKKPGRKPLMNEPSSKRKAQNRAAQRAFRERKEKHLKDLETKVEELEKASDVANSENSQLRNRIDKLTVELNEYKKRVQLTNADSRSSSLNKQSFGAAAIGNLNDVNFQFEFPQFGKLPGPSASTNGSTNRSTSYPSPHSNSNTSKQNSPANSSDQPSPNTESSRANSESMSKEALSKLTNGGGNGSIYDSALFGNASRTSLDSTALSLSGFNTGSPSSSSNSNAGPSSSCGTSPEPCTQSPHGFKPLDTLTTIGEEQPSNNDSQAPFGHFGNVDFSNIDWLSQQNGGQFDPQLFGGYREPQNNVLAGTSFDDSFFNDAFDVDFTEPFNVAPSQPAPKKNLIAEIDSRKETEDTISSNGKLLTCNNIWEKLQTCPKVQSGDLDLDGLCTDLQKKAKCGGTGAVVDELDFQTIMTKYLGVDAKNCPGNP